ncbi:MAG: MFS transporter, partial [Desulfobacteraceae bacterium]|nr:MFS transporter [Desulfobacteraceae bacterium]
TTGSAAKMGAVLAASLIPSFVLGFFSGTFIDRYNRKIIIVGTDVIRGIIIGLFALLFYLDMMHFYLILIMQALLSVNAAFFDPAIPSVIPQIVKKEDIARANSLHQFVNGFSTIAGAFFGGIFTAMFGYIFVFILNAVSFILSAFFESFITIPQQQHLSESKTFKETRFLDEMKQGYQYIFSDRIFVVLLFMVMVIHFFVGSIEVFMPVIATSVSGSGPETLGFFHAAFGLGTVVVAVVLSIKTISGREMQALFTAVFFMGTLLVAASFFKWHYGFVIHAFLAMLFLFGGAIICAGISFKTLLQKNVDNHFSGRVFGVVGSVGNASIPLAMIVYGFLLDLYDIHGLLLISGLVLMPVSIFSYMICKEKKDVSTKEATAKIVP